MKTNDLDIGIFTFQNAINIGAYLQAYALSEVIKKIVHTYDYHANIYFPYRFSLWRQRYDIISKNCEKLSFNICRYKKFLNSQKKLNQKRLPFYNLAIFGSDSIWDISEKTSGYIPEMYGIGVSAIEKISYAGSFGTLKNKENHKWEAVESLKQMDSISVRDKNSYALLSDNRSDINLVLDPTLLFDFDTSDTLDTDLNYIMVYGGFGAELQKRIIKFSRKVNLKLLSVGTFNPWCDDSIPVSPEEFISYIKNAKYVVTSMYHGSIFAMKYRKKFVSYFTEQRLVKANTTFDILGMSDRLITDESDLEMILLGEPDYFRFEKELDKYRKKSFVYLEKLVKETIEKIKN